MQEEKTAVNDNEQAQNAAPEQAAEQVSDAETQQPADNTNEALVVAQKQAQEYLDGWQRERAEFSNYRRRVERELKDSQQNASTDLLKGLLPIIDDFERALSSAPADMQNHPWMNGVTLIYRKFQKMLDDQGVTVIDPVGEVFDPSRHEAVGTDSDTNVESGHVTATLQKGYLRGDRVLRPALVRVAS